MITDFNGPTENYKNRHTPEYQNKKIGNTSHKTPAPPKPVNTPQPKYKYPWEDTSHR